MTEVARAVAQIQRASREQDDRTHEVVNSNQEMSAIRTATAGISPPSCREIRAIRFEFAASFTEIGLSDVRALVYLAYPLGFSSHLIRPAATPPDGSRFVRASRRFVAALDLMRESGALGVGGAAADHGVGTEAAH